MKKLGVALVEELQDGREASCKSGSKCRSRRTNALMNDNNELLMGESTQKLNLLKEW